MNIVVTGSNGFVGKHLTELLKRDKNVQIFGLDKAQADITKYSEVKKYLEKVKPDQIYHLAGFASGAGKDKDLIFRVNVDGTLNILKTLKEISKPVKVLLASTAYVYGNTPTCATEKSKLDAKSFYDKSKVEMEREALKYSSSEQSESRSSCEDGSRQARTINNLEIVITRATNHTGPGQNLGFAVPDFCSQIVQAKSDENIFVGNLVAKRDLFDVRDCVKAYKLIMEKGKSGEIYNIGTGKTITIEVVLDKIIKISGKKITHSLDPERKRPSDIKKNCVDSSKLKKLGWKPEISLDKTLKDTYEYFKNGNQLNEVYKDWAVAYDEYAMKHNMATKKVHRTFENLIANNSNKGIGLDLGCGTGLVTQIASKYAKEIIGIDRNEAMLAEARKKISQGAKLDFKSGDITKKLELPDNHFDFVISSLVFSHIDNVKPIFKEIYRVLKDDGIFIFDEPDSSTRTPEQLKFKPRPKVMDPLLKYKDIGGKVWYSRNLQEEIKVLENAGFKIEEIIEIKYDEEVRPLMKNYKYHEGRAFFNIIKAKKQS